MQSLPSFRSSKIEPTRTLVGDPFWSGNLMLSRIDLVFAQVWVESGTELTAAISSRASRQLYLSDILILQRSLESFRLQLACDVQ